MARQESDEAFRRFYEAHYGAIYRFVALRVPDGAVAADIVSEVFATSWRRRAVLPDPPFDRPWLFGVAKHTLSTYRRGETRRNRLIHRISSERTFEPRTPADTGPLMEAFARLRPLDREALRLVVWDEMAVAEAAAVMGCSVSAMNVRLHRARRRLASELSTASDKSVPSGDGRRAAVRSDALDESVGQVAQAQKEQQQ